MSAYVFVDGAASMIGAATVAACLKNDLEVYAVLRKDTAHLDRLPKDSRLHILFCELDRLKDLPQLLEREGGAKGEGLAYYHFAWALTGPGRNASIERQMENVRYTLDALHAAAELGCRCFIGAGSQAEYGSRQGKMSGPDSPAFPDTAYGAAKLAACHAAFILGRELGIGVIWTRIFSIYGIYEKPTTLIQSTLRKLEQGDVTAFTPAEQLWDYLYSEDAGRAFFLLGTKGRPGRIYCIGSGQARPLKEYLAVLAATVGVPLRGIGELPYPEHAVMQLCADISELTADTGFVPEVSFEEGIRRTYEWIREYGK